MASALAHPAASALRPLALALGAALLGACTARPSFAPGDECELNSNCLHPLVCRLGRCRLECRGQRDCPAGLECVRDERGLGACQLLDETGCTLSSDCPRHLVCHFGRCTNECEADRDCPPGARCLTDPAGGRGCRDGATMECALNSDCAPGSGLICAADGRCREACREDWDCSDERRCVPDGPLRVCRPPDELPPEAGPRDGSVPPNDAPGDGGPSDGGSLVAPPPPPPPRMAAGLQGTCAAPEGRELHCWGANGDGQVGDGTRTPRPAPQSVFGFGRPAVVGVGHGHACAPLGDRLHCWGRNTRGQLGQGATTTARYLAPVEVPGLPAGPVEDLALGAQHSCAIVAERLFCWGGNESGQLGVGDLVDRLSPTEVTGLSDVPVQVSTFSVHTCVRGRSGVLECFGENGNGQLGRGSRADGPSPQRVPGLRVLAVAAGGAHTCAIRVDGQLSCWGSDALGQAGDGGRVGAADHLSPVAASSLPAPALQIAAGSAHTCARTAGSSYCWGDNFRGQAGRDPAMTDVVLVPTEVRALGIVEEVALGSLHSCARTGGSVRCFGDNADGQLGLGAGALSETSSPSEVAWP